MPDVTLSAGHVGAVLTWLVVLNLLAVVALPLATRLFPRFPDRGAAFALPVALAVLTLAAYWLGHVAFGVLTVAAAFVVLAAASAVLSGRGFSFDRRRHAEAMALFSAAFLFFVAVRAVDPAVHPAGGEKFLDFGLLKAILRADALPPEDMWFAGEPVRYYYGGILLSAVLARATATPASVAYNLALATFWAMLVTAAYGLAGAMAARHGHSTRATGLLAAFLVGFAGNLATPARLLLGLVPPDLRAAYGHAFLAGIRSPYEETLATATHLDTWNYWLGRYVVPDTITVFPLWSFLNGDLHAHAMVTPFLLLGAALAFAYYRTPEAEVTRRRVLVFGALPAVAGLTALVSTWSFPTVVGLTWLAVTFADARARTLLPDRFQSIATPSLSGRPRGVGRELGSVVGAAGVAVATGVLGFAVAFPYLVFHSPDNGGVGFFPPGSTLGGLLLVHGVFLAAFALFFGRRLLARSDRERTWLVALATVVAVAAVLGLGVVTELEGFAAFGPLLLAGWLLARRDDAAGFETVLVVAGAGLLLVVEVAYAKVWPYDPNAPRWNTLYKVSMQAWVLWGTAAAVAITRALDGLPALPSLRSAVAAVRAPSLRLPSRTVVLRGVVALLLVGAATFPAVALGEHFGRQVAGDNPPDVTLDATHFVDVYRPAEAEAIDWLDARPGTPTIVTKPGEPMYTWVSAPSSLTGVPTLLGWRHEKGYRGDAAYRERTLEVEAIYSAQWWFAAEQLAAHDVDYVYVGPNEREAYDVRDFENRTGISVAFENEAITIYAVDHDTLCTPPDVECPTE
ncbi:DUF2298 domain-containing protein [Halobacteriaceae archaeon GCM10025711]